jgi:hypothetical protein
MKGRVMTKITDWNEFEKRFDAGESIEKYTIPGTEKRGGIKVNFDQTIELRKPAYKFALNKAAVF